jgi:hypothetical protein
MLRGGAIANNCLIPGLKLPKLLIDKSSKSLCETFKHRTASAIRQLRQAVASKWLTGYRPFSLNCKQPHQFSIQSAMTCPSDSEE